MHVPSQHAPCMSKFSLAAALRCVFAPHGGFPFAYSTLTLGTLKQITLIKLRSCV